MGRCHAGRAFRYNFLHSDPEISGRNCKKIFTTIANASVTNSNLLLNKRIS